MFLLVGFNFLLAVEPVGILDKWVLFESAVFPLVWCEELECFLHGLVCGDKEVECCLCVAEGRCEEIFEASHCEELLSGCTSDDAGTTWSWD